MRCTHFRVFPKCPSPHRPRLSSLSALRLFARFPNNPHASHVSSRLLYLAPDAYILIPLGSCGLTGICGEAINLGVVGMAGLFGAECAQRTGGADKVFCGEVFVDAG